MSRGGFEKIIGVDLYQEAGRLRTDDLAVRGWAEQQLVRAAQTLSAAAAEYRRVAVPPPTREQPFPPPELLEPAVAARRCADRYTAAAQRVRDAPFPPDPKKAFKRLRGPGAARMLDLDRSMLAQAEYAAALVREATAETLAMIPDREVQEALGALAVALDERIAYLNAV